MGARVTECAQLKSPHSTPPVHLSSPVEISSISTTPWRPTSTSAAGGERVECVL